MTGRKILGGAAAVMAAALLFTGLPAAAAPEGAAMRPSVARPTGPHAVGKTDLRLLDPDRADPWVGSEKRQLMTTVWYPAGGGGEPAPYTGPELANHLDRTVTPELGLDQGRVDWANIETHAAAAPPVTGRAGGYPVVLYSPGAFESRVYGSGAAADLASHGYVVVTVDHTYETEVEFPDGLRPRVADAGDPDQAALLRKVFDVRVRDTHFVLDELTELGAGRKPDADGRALPPGLGAALDLDSVGMVGHSAGGDTAAQAMSEDRRIDSAVDMDGFLAYDSMGEQPMPVAEHGLDRPFLLMGSESSVSELPPPGQQPDWILRTHHSNPAWASLWNRSTAGKLDLAIPRARHHVFTDHLAILLQLEEIGVPGETVAGLIGSTADPGRVSGSVRAYVEAFFEQHLRHRPQPLLDGPSPHHPDIRFVR
ncbi:alpha/beta hydrolase family protein [Amycolatopsis antarctica]|nr:lipase [Amycolatopsis antarctica]